MNLLEITLLTNLKAGDDKAFEIIYNTYFRSLFNYAESLLHSADNAEDIISVVFVTLWEQRTELSIETSLQSYLFRCVYNACINLIRKKKVEEKYKSFFLYYFDEGYSQGNSYPLENILEQELEEKIGSIISGLPEQCRAMFLMSREEGLSHNEIAIRSGVSVNTVRTQISRALCRFRKELKDFLPVIISLLVFCS
jgi:RNA polymerase sigma-70 factor, ECF subfamily